MSFGGVACIPSKPYAAIVNGKVISEVVIERDIKATTSNPALSRLSEDDFSALGGLRPGGPNTVNSRFAATLVYVRILSILIDEEIARQKVPLTAEDFQRTEQALRSRIGDPALFDSVDSAYRKYNVDTEAKLAALMAYRNTPQGQRAYYDANIRRYDETCYRSVTVVTEQQARDVKERVRGGQDFAAIAREVAGGQPLRNQKGEPVAPDTVNCTSVSQLLPQDREFVNSIPVNSVSEPLATPGSFTLVQVTSRGQRSFDQVQPEISSTLSQPENFFDEALARSKIKVNPRYGELKMAKPEEQQPAGVYPRKPSALSSGSRGDDQLLQLQE